MAADAPNPTPAMLVSFYQVKGETPGAVDAVLPALLGKAMGAGPVLLVAPTEGRMQRLEEALWEPGAAFLPHGVAGGAHDSLQPVLLVSAQGEVANAGRLPVVLSGAEGALEGLVAGAEGRVLYVFESAASSVERARGLWKSLKGRAGVGLRYWAQEGAGWVAKA